MDLSSKLRRKTDTHKGDYGHVLIVGGSSGLTGAVCLAGRSCLKSGAGLVTAGVPESLNTIFETKLTEVMTLCLPCERGCLSQSAFPLLSKFIEKIDVLVLGPGASLSKTTQVLMRKIISQINKPMVIDADAITALSFDLSILDKRKAKDIVLTPHLGEFSRLIKKDKQVIKKKRKELVKNFSIRYNLSLVLKGHRTLISSANKLIENKTGNPGMATAGMGDVLSGIIAAFIAQGFNAHEAAKTAVYLHGLAADLAVKDKTENCLIASDVIDYLPKAFKAFYKKRYQG
ncbi:MAG: NAD(P)H-hydrate dehydratase [Candidatus Omnitrophica bacterium]|nr:NAD(P)H-hydrate dehydratase [Candidatus Omnitrophota bacterium]